MASLRAACVLVLHAQLHGLPLARVVEGPCLTASAQLVPAGTTVQCQGVNMHLHRFCWIVT